MIQEGNNEKFWISNDMRTSVVPPTSSLFSWGAARVAQLEGVEMTVHVDSEGESGTGGYAASPG